MNAPLADDILARLYTEARTHRAFLATPVDDALLHRLYELTRLGPTSANNQPLRVVFVRTAEAKERLRPSLSPANVDKVMKAPLTAILAWDTRFHEQMPRLFPARPELKESFGGLPTEAHARVGVQSATLQAGYFILAARALGLDCGPLGGFDAGKVDAAFFGEGDTAAWRTMLLVNLGVGDASQLHPRLPRLSFADACRIA